MRYSIVIPTHNGASTLGATLDALCAQKMEFDYEIIVVDNNSTDATREIIASYGGVRYVFEKEQGVSAARNAGIGAARGDIIAFTDDDCQPVPGWLHALETTYGVRPDAWSVGGRILVDPFPYAILRAPGCDMRALFAHLDLGAGIVKIVPPRALWTANLSVKRAIVSRIGMFDTRLGKPHGTGEDLEFCGRVHRSGGTIYYCGDALVRHIMRPGRMTKQSLRTVMTKWGRSEVLLRGPLSTIGALREMLAMGKDVGGMLAASVIGKSFPYELLARRHFAYLWYGWVMYNAFSKVPKRSDDPRSAGSGSRLTSF